MKHISFVGTRQHISWFFANAVCQPVSPPPDFLSTSGHSSLRDPLSCPQIASHVSSLQTPLEHSSPAWSEVQMQGSSASTLHGLAHALACLAKWTWLRSPSTVEVICYCLCKAPHSVVNSHTGGQQLLSGIS